MLIFPDISDIMTISLRGSSACFVQEVLAISYACVCVCERERVRMCVYEREREFVCVCERERQIKTYMCVCMRE